MKCAVILPAAGQSTRFNTTPSPNLGPSEAPDHRPSSKVELELAGKPVFLHAIDAFLNHPDVGTIILAVNPASIDDFRFRFGDQLGLQGVTIVPGGTRQRWETVLRAIQAVPDDCTHIAIHDAARPLVSPALIERVFTAARRHPAVIPAMPVNQTLKRVGDPRTDDAAPDDPLDAILSPAAETSVAVRPVIETVDRSDLVEAQTPQVFHAALLRRAYAPLADGSTDAPHVTDDASLVEALGEPVVVVEGEPTNLKLTRPGDAELAAALLQSRAAATAKQTASKRLFLDDEDD